MSRKVVGTSGLPIKTPTSPTLVAQTRDSGKRQISCRAVQGNGYFSEPHRSRALAKPDVGDIISVSGSLSTFARGTMKGRFPILASGLLALVVVIGVFFAAPQVSAILNKGKLHLRVESEGPMPAASSSGNVVSQAPSAPPILTESAKEKARRYLGYIGVDPTEDGLLASVRNSQTYAIELLVKAGISLECTDAKGRTPLMLAVESGHGAVVKTLLVHGAQLNKTDPQGRTALMIAAAAGSEGMIEKLLARRADVTLSDLEGHTALYYAIAAKAEGAVRLLVKAGAPREGECGDHKTVFKHALESGDRNIAMAVLENYPPAGEWTPEMTDAFWTAYREKDGEMLSRLSAAHLQPPPLPGSSQPLLAEAVLWNDLDLVDRLLAWGVDPNTTLHIPADSAFIESTGKKGLRYYLESEQGITVLMLAGGLGHYECLEKLLAAGARKNKATEHYRMIALEFAARTGNAESIQVLLGRSPKPSDQELEVKISLSTQQATVLKNGVTWLKTTVSTGRKKFPTPTGKFVVTDKHRERISTIYEVPMPYFMRLSCSSFGMHEGYVPGYPASHGCIRIPGRVARKIFQVVDVGTLVTISD